MEKYPELGVVQDADRLDGMGAVGIGRVFTFGGAKMKDQNMQDSVIIFEIKLLKLVALMKTGPGKRMGEERAAVLRVFRKWWDEDMGVAEIWEGGRDENAGKKSLAERARELGYEHSE